MVQTVVGHCVVAALRDHGVVAEVEDQRIRHRVLLKCRCAVGGGGHLLHGVATRTYKPNPESRGLWHLLAQDE